MFSCRRSRYNAECCVCRETKRIFVTCKICSECQCCEVCSTTMLEGGQLRLCPICRQPKWRNNVVPLTSVVPLRMPSITLRITRPRRSPELPIEEIENFLAECGGRAIKTYRYLTNAVMFIGITWLIGMLVFAMFDGPPTSIHEQTWIPLLWGFAVNIICLCLCNSVTDGACMRSLVD